MRPHLHILLPSSTSRVALEVRLYLPPEAGPCPAPLSNSPNSQPYTVGPADTQLEQWLRSCEIERLVTACHPWGKLGGSCLDPVIADHLVNAIFEGPNDAGPDSRPSTALLTWNVRGVGLSQGSMGIFGLNNQTNERDLETLEEWALNRMPVKEVKRFGYSWGSWAALSPTRRDDLRPSSIFLVSPPVSLFGLLSLPFIFNRSHSFRSYLDSYLSSSPDQTGHPVSVTIAYGTTDEFTSKDTYAALEKAYDTKAPGRLKIFKLDGAGHFYRAEEHGQWLTGQIREWINAL